MLKVKMKLTRVQKFAAYRLHIARMKTPSPTRVHPFFLRLQSFWKHTHSFLVVFLLSLLTLVSAVVLMLVFFGGQAS